MRYRGPLLLVLGLTLSGGGAPAQQTCPNLPPSIPGEQLGCSVAASGSLTAYGANMGNRVLVSEGNGFQVLTASDGAAGDQFGFSLGVDGETLAVGAPTADGPGGADSGAVYVFRKQGGRWVQEAKLTAGDGAPGAQLGFSLALRNGTLAVGAALDGARGSLSGAVYVFERGETGWAQRAKLTGARTRAFDELGAAVSLDGGVLAAGAPFADGRAGGNQGAVHLFEKRGGTWVETGVLTASGAAAGDQLGFAVSIQGNTLAAGARRGDVDGRADAGWVAVFRREGGDWRQTARITAGATAQAGELFGGAVSLSEGRLLVGASQADGSHGATYLFEETGEAWTLLQRTSPPADLGPGRFGFSVALSGATVVAGAFMANDSAGFVACGSVPIRQEPVPRLTIDDVSLDEGNSGTRPFIFTVSLSSPAGAGGVSFDVATAPGTAKAGTDYTTRRLTRQRIPAGSSTYSFSVAVKGDTSPEANETFFVNVKNVTGANVTDGRGVGTIRNDDVPGQPMLTIGDVSLSEGNSGTKAFAFTVSLSSPAGAGGVRFDVATAPGTATAGIDYVPKSLTGQTIPKGKSTYTFTVLVQGDTSPEPDETFFVKVANVTGAVVADDQGQGTIQNDDLDGEQDSADLSVTKVADPDPVQAGNNLTYTITVSNAGPSSAASVSLSDALPAGTAFVSLSFPDLWSCTTPAVGAGGTVSCTTASLGVGSAVFTLTVAIAPSTPAGSVLTNTATVSSATTDPNPGNQSGSATTTVGVGSADLSVAQMGSPDLVTAGNNLTYTLAVTNSGPSNATSASLSDPLPPGTGFVSLASPGGWSCTTPALGSGGTVFCSIPSLATGNAVFTLIVAVAPSTPIGTIFTNTATIASPTTDPNPGDNMATAISTVISPATISGTKSVAGNFIPGGNVIYSVVLSNTGPSRQSDNPGNEFIDVLPVGLNLLSAAASSGTVALSMPTRTVTWDGALDVGAPVTISITANIAAGPGTTLTNQGTISYDADGNGVNESPALTDDPSVAGAFNPTSFQVKSLVSGTKTVSGSFGEGGTVTYTVTLTNNGPGAQPDAPGNEFTDTLSASLTLVSATASSPAVATAGNTVTWNGGIPAGGSVTITIQAAINAGTAGATITNQGTIFYDANGNGLHDPSEVTVTDDPSVGGAADPTSFQVAAPLAGGPVLPPPIPILDTTGLALLILLLALGGAVMLRRRA